MRGNDRAKGLHVSEQNITQGNVVNRNKLDTPTAANVPPAVTDIARLRDAFDRLDDAGFIVLDGGCCSSCNWGHIDREHPDAEDVVHVNDQALDGAFGEIEPSIEWRAYLDAAVGEAETDARYEQWLDHWYSDDFVGLDPRVAQRPGMLRESLWLQHDGNTARAITILRAAGLDAQWNGDPNAAIELKARVDTVARDTVVMGVENVEESPTGGAR